MRNGSYFIVGTLIKSIEHQPFSGLVGYDHRYYRPSNDAMIPNRLSGHITIHEFYGYGGSKSHELGGRCVGHMMNFYFSHRATSYECQFKQSGSLWVGAFKQKTRGIKEKIIEQGPAQCLVIPVMKNIPKGLCGLVKDLLKKELHLPIPKNAYAGNGL